jgi:hypothetical protein
MITIDAAAEAIETARRSALPGREHVAAVRSDVRRHAHRHEAQAP